MDIDSDDSRGLIERRLDLAAGSGAVQGISG
jgi:hypothetical protein